MEIGLLTVLLISNAGSEALEVKRKISGSNRKIFLHDSPDTAISEIRSSREKYDIILIDLDLGVRTINSLTSALSVSDYNDVPLLYLYGNPGSEVFENAETANSFGFAAKSSNQIVLLSSIRLAIRLHKANKELRIKEEAVSESQYRLNRAESVSKSGNWELHLDSGIMIASEGAPKIYGLNVTKISYSELLSVPLPEYRAMLNKALKELVENGTPYDVEFKIRKVDTGEIIDVHSVAEFDPENRIIFGIIRDITKRKKAEEEVEKKK